jgi:hypothetical protein
VRSLGAGGMVPWVYLYPPGMSLLVVCRCCSAEVWPCARRWAGSGDREKPATAWGGVAGAAMRNPAIADGVERRRAVLPLCRAPAMRNPASNDGVWLSRGVGRLEALL